MNNRFCPATQKVKKKEMKFEIPILADFLRLCINHDFYDNVIKVVGVLVVAFFVLNSFKTVPYGKTYTANTSILKTEVKDRLAVILINLPGLIIFTYSQIFYPNGDLFSISSLLFIGHYIHRALIYPFFRKVYSKPWPLESVLYYFVCNTITGLLTSHVLIFSGKTLNIYIQIVLALLFIAFAVAAGVHDYILCSLRSAGPQGYRIPYGYMFKYVSGPNYLFELLEWIVYFFFLPWTLQTVLIIAFYYMNITARAETNHMSYCTKRKESNNFWEKSRVTKIFPKGTKYPEERAPWFPFVHASKFIF